MTMDLALGRSRDIVYVDEELGRIWTPPDVLKTISLPGKAVRRLFGPGEVGVFVAKQHRPVYEDGLLKRLELLWWSISHNERVDQGAVKQDVQCFGAASATRIFTAIAIANATLAAKAKTDLSLASITANVTTNEFTSGGLARAAGSLSTYTAPSTLGGQFSRIITSGALTYSGGGATAYGAGLFDNGATTNPSNLYVEDNFSNGTAVLATSDTLTVNITISN